MGQIEHLKIVTAEEMLRVPVLRAIVRARTKSDSPAYVEADWYTARTVRTTSGDTEVEWVRGTADPEAGKSRRKWTRGLVLGIAQTAMHEERGALELYSDIIRPSVAYYANGHTHVGILPDGFGEIVVDDEDIYVASLREGPEAPLGILGLGTRRGREFWAFGATKKIADKVNTKTLSPKVPLA